MVRIILKKNYLTIVELMERWQKTIHDIQYVVENGEIKLYVRPLLIEASRNSPLPCPALERLKHAPLYPIDIYKLFHSKNDRVPIKQLQGMSAKELLKYTIEICFDDMIVWFADVEKFEQEYGSDAVEAFVLLSPDYRAFKIQDEEIRFGDKQAAIAKYLHERLKTTDPWVHGKELMHVAKSASWKIQSLFCKHKNWRKAILSNGRGYYKFNLAQDI